MTNQNPTSQSTDNDAVDGQDNNPPVDTDTSAQTDHTLSNDGVTHHQSDTEKSTTSQPENTQNSDTETTPESENTESENSDSGDDLRTTVNFGVDVDDADVDAFISLSEQLGLNAEQAQNAWDTLQQAQAEQEQADAAMAKVYDGQLRQMWGNAYDNNYASAQQGIVSAGGDDLRDILTSAGLINHPVIMQTFAKIGQSYLEQGTVPSNAGGMHNPFHSDTYNLTEQMRLYRENPSLAAMLEKAATSS